jgi:hypothetical protein
MRAALVLIASAALFCDFDEAERDQLPNSGGNRFAVELPLHELVERHLKTAIFGTAVAHVLDLQPVLTRIADTLSA